MDNFKLVSRYTSYLLLPSVDEWLSQGHLARFVVEVTDQVGYFNYTTTIYR